MKNKKPLLTLALLLGACEIQYDNPTDSEIMQRTQETCINQRLQHVVRCGEHFITTVHLTYRFDIKTGELLEQLPNGVNDYSKSRAECKIGIRDGEINDGCRFKDNETSASLAEIEAAAIAIRIQPND